MRPRWKGSLAGLALATILSLVLSWPSFQFDYDSGLNLLRPSWDGAHWGTKTYGELSVQPLGWFFGNIVFRVAVFAISAALVLCTIGYVVGHSRERPRTEQDS